MDRRVGRNRDSEGIIFFQEVSKFWHTFKVSNIAGGLNKGIFPGKKGGRGIFPKTFFGGSFAPMEEGVTL